ncbi:hypothetical protein AYO41_02665 [Verrucomicrobia bacterium SCGC AG-212-E04]|nr:hypothetical protein AYO41_02665 [Verrucomicrobia bacterium SCGC AG-212-E04]
MIWHCRIAGVQRVITAVMLAAYVLVLAMASCPSLHQWLHDDADEPDHQCAAVTASQGQIDQPAGQPAIAAAPATVWLEPRPALYALTIARLFLVTRVLEHAPPIG